MKHFTSLFLPALAYLITSCQAQSQKNISATALSSHFNDYWHTGKAEVASYDLAQSRYGEIYQGNAVLIFVTEDFSKARQVKLDYPQKSIKDKVKVLKLNFTKKFNTGIYPYSIMQSIFTPIDRSKYTNSLKITMSSQEWCGHIYTQLNLKKDIYEGTSFSYFEQEGDKQWTMNKTLLEDEIWNLIRLNYQSLPTGEVKVIPGIFHSRLLHKPLQITKAKASLMEQGEEMTYRLDYKGENKSLSITFDKAFPHKILSWKEITSTNGKVFTTKAILKKTLHVDYWNKNKNKHAYLRDSLGLE